jgi:hypothetical protein
MKRILLIGLLQFVVIFAQTANKQTKKSVVSANDSLLPVICEVLKNPIEGKVDTTVNFDFDGDGSVEKLLVKDSGKYGYLFLYDYDDDSKIYLLLKMGGGEAEFIYSTCWEIRDHKDYTGDNIPDIHFFESGCGSGGKDYIFSYINKAWLCVFKTESDFGGIKFVSPGKIKQIARVLSRDKDTGNMDSEVIWDFDKNKNRFSKSSKKITGELNR